MHLKLSEWELLKQTIAIYKWGLATTCMEPQGSHQYPWTERGYTYHWPQKIQTTMNTPEDQEKSVNLPTVPCNEGNGV